MSEKRQKNEFEELLEQSFQKRKKISTGASYKVKVREHKNGYLFIRTQEGTNGIVPEIEFSILGEKIPSIGEEIEVFFLNENHGDYIFTYCLHPENLEQQLIEAALEAEIPIAGTVTGKIKGGYSVKLGSYIAFCPESQLDSSVKESWTGKVLRFVVSEIQKNGIVVSQKKLAEKEKEQRKAFLKEELKEGSFVSCKVKSIHSFGLIVDVEGMDAMIPRSEATYKPGGELDFKPGETLRARVLQLNWPENKITLSVKDFIQDPWSAKIPFREGDIIEGKVESIRPFGIFVKLNDFFNGLVPIRETGIEGRSPLTTSFKPGAKLEVFVMEINPEKRQISLSVKKASESRSRMDYQNYLTDDSQTTTSSLGDLLKKSLKEGK